MGKQTVYFTYLVDFCTIVALAGVMWKISIRQVTRDIHLVQALPRAASSQRQLLSSCSNQYLIGLVIKLFPAHPLPGQSCSAFVACYHYKGLLIYLWYRYETILIFIIIITIIYCGLLVVPVNNLWAVKSLEIMYYVTYSVYCNKGCQIPNLSPRCGLDGTLILITVLHLRKRKEMNWLRDKKIL